MERFDIVDQNDRVVGTANRDEVHGNPALIHRVVHILIFNKQQGLYLQKRAPSKDVQPGKWDTSVGGHVDLGEDYRTAAIREMGEELGIETERIEFLYKYLHRNDYESEYVSSFRCYWDGPFIINRDEIAAGRFWSFQEIQERMATGIFTPNFLDELNRYLRYLACADESE